MPETPDHWGAPSPLFPDALSPEEASAAAQAAEQKAFLEARKKEARAFVERFQPLFQTIASDSSLRYEVGDGFFIDYKKGVITLDVKDFIHLHERGVNLWQIAWSVGHEIGHFLDLKQNPEAMMEHFAYLQRRARELTPRAAKIIRDAHGDKWADRLEKPFPQVEGVENPFRTPLEQFLYKKLHLLNNSLDDMYVNRVIGEVAPVFAPHGNAGGDVEELYRTYLFPAKPTQDGSISKERVEGPVDYTKMPRSHQLAYSLLRQRMVPGEAVEVVEEVRAALDDYPSDTARKLGLNLRTLVNHWTTPGVNGKTKHPKTGNQEYCERNPGWRKNRIREKVEPVFVELLMADLQDLKPPPPGKPEPSPWDELDQKPEHMDLDLANGLKKQIQATEDEKAKAAAEAKKKADMSPKERIASAQAEADKKLCARDGTDPKLAEEYREIEKEIEPFKHALAAVFEEFMRTLEERITAYYIGHFKKGKASIRALVRRYAPELANDAELPMDPTSLKYFLRHEFISRLSISPTKVRSRLLIDGSGSMAGEKIKLARQISALYLEGFASFEETMNLRYRLKDPFKTDTEIRVFGTHDTVARPFTSDDPSSTGPTAKFRAFDQIRSDKGATCDAASFEAVDQSLDPSQVADLKQGKAREFLLYIADGGSSTAEASAVAIAAIQAKGVICKGLLLGTPSDSEQETFKNMFGQHGAQVPDITKLVEVVTELLREEIQQIAIQVMPYEDAGSEMDE